MAPSSLPGHTRARTPLAILVLPFATYALASSFAAGESYALAVAESRFLALVIACATALMAALRPDRPAIAITGSGLALVALTTIGTGTTRGAVCMAVLAAGLTLAASGSRVRARSQQDLPFLLSLAFAVQLFARPQLLLAPHTDAWRLASLLVMPTVAAVCGQVVARRWGMPRVLIAGGACALIGPGLTLTTTLVWVALAGGALWRRSTRDTAAGDTAAGRTMARRSLALTLILLPVVVLAIEDAALTGVTVALAAVLLADDRRATRIAVATAALAALALAVSLGLGNAASADTLLAIGLGVMALIPAALRFAPSDLDRLAACAALLVLAARADDPPQAVVAVVAVLALAIDSEGATLRLQAWWTGTTLVLASLLAAYPWVRAHPRDDALALLGLDDPRGVLIGALALIGLGALLDRLREPRNRQRWSALVAAAGAAVVLLATAPAPPLDTFSPAVALDASGSDWGRPLGDPRRVRSVVVESSLTNSLVLPADALLATVTLHDAEGKALGQWRLHSDRHTAEWAAERADVARRLGDRRPDPHAAAVAADGTFFARRYRTRFVLDRPVTGVTRVAVRRSRRLPEPVQLVLHRVEIAP